MFTSDQFRSWQLNERVTTSPCFSVQIDSASWLSQSLTSGWDVPAFFWAQVSASVLRPPKLWLYSTRRSVGTSWSYVPALGKDAINRNTKKLNTFDTPEFCLVPERALDLRSLFMTTHGDEGKMVRNSEFLVFASWVPSDDRKSEKLSGVDRLLFVPMCCHNKFGMSNRETDLLFQQCGGAGNILYFSKTHKWGKGGNAFKLGLSKTMIATHNTCKSLPQPKNYQWLRRSPLEPYLSC